MMVCFFACRLLFIVLLVKVKTNRCKYYIRKQFNQKQVRIDAGDHSWAKIKTKSRGRERMLMDLLEVYFYIPVMLLEENNHCVNYCIQL